MRESAEWVEAQEWDWEAAATLGCVDGAYARRAMLRLPAVGRDRHVLGRSNRKARHLRNVMPQMWRREGARYQTDAGWDCWTCAAEGRRRATSA